MPRHPHRHRRRRSGSRAARWLPHVALGTVVLIGTAVLVELLAESPAGRVVLGGAALASVLVALPVLSCLAARLAAWVRNALSVHAAHADLARFMRSDEAFRAARRCVARPLV